MDGQHAPSGAGRDALKALVLFLTNYTEDDLRRRVAGCASRLASFTQATESMHGRDRVDAWRSNTMKESAACASHLVALGELRGRLRL